MNLESLQDLFHLDTLAHESPFLMVLYQHSQKISEFACHNLEVTMQLINKYIDFTHFTPRVRRRRRPNGLRQLPSCHYVGAQINVGPLY
jgi:hypothetical protein